MGRKIDQTGEHARREIHAGERQPSGETLEHRAKLDQNGDIDEEMKRPGVHERGRHKTPPLAVRRARPEARAPCDERIRIADRVRAEEHAADNDHVDGDERRRHERASRARPKRIAERFVLRSWFDGRDLQPPDKTHRDDEVSRSVLRRGQSVPNNPKDREQEDEAHVMATSIRVPEDPLIRASFPTCWSGPRRPVTFLVASPTFMSDHERYKTCRLALLRDARRGSW